MFIVLQAGTQAAEAPAEGAVAAELAAQEEGPVTLAEEEDDDLPLAAVLDNIAREVEAAPREDPLQRAPVLPAVGAIPVAPAVPPVATGKRKRAPKKAAGPRSKKKPQPKGISKAALAVLDSEPEEPSDGCESDDDPVLTGAQALIGKKLEVPGEVFKVPGKLFYALVRRRTAKGMYELVFDDDRSVWYFTPEKILQWQVHDRCNVNACNVNACNTEPSTAINTNNADVVHYD